jgi:FlaA1/EpsC-like NDP-sugar epimerase
LTVADAACIVAALQMSRALLLPSDSTFELLVIVVAAAAWVATFHGFGLYGVRHLAAAEEFRRLISAVSLGVFLILFGPSWLGQPLGRRGYLGLTWLFALLLELVIRRLARWHVRRQKREGRLSLRTRIIGTNNEAERIAQALESPARGFLPLGFVSAPEHVHESKPDMLPIVAVLDDLDRAIRTNDAECVFVASTAVSEMEMYRISSTCRRSGIEMRVSRTYPTS